MLRAMLFMVAVMSCGSAAIAGLREQCLELIGIAVDDVGILTCTAAIRENDRDGELYAARGHFYAQFKEYDRAIDDFRRARELDNTIENTDYVLGVAYLAKGDLDQAIALFGKVILRKPDDHYAYINALSKRGESYRRKGDLNRALGDLNDANALYLHPKPGDPADYYPEGYHSNPLCERGLVYASLRQFELAIADFTDAMSRAEIGGWPTALILSHRGEAHLKLGAFAQAIADADKAIELDAKSADFAALRARIREAMGQKAEAIQDYRRALSVDPKHTNSLESLKRLGASP